MRKNFDNFSMEQLQKMAQSPAGQQLYAMLKEQNNDQLQNAMAHAASGDMQQAKNALSDILSDPKALVILKKLTEDAHGGNGR